MTLIAKSRISLLLLASLMPMLISGCASKSPAQVVERVQPAKKNPPPRVVRPREPDWRPTKHVVERGDTLHAIALAYGYDYREIADLNGIAPPYLIRVGQELKLPGAGASVQAVPGVAVTAPLKQAGTIVGKPLSATVEAKAVTKTQPKALKLPYSPEALTQIAELERSQDQAERPASKVAEAPVVRIDPKPETLATQPPKTETQKQKALSDDNKSTQIGEAKPEDGNNADEESIEWVWPTTGKVLAGFNEGGSKGIDIGGRSGQPVLAAAPGKVVYSGNNLRGYGNLVIIKHNKTYLSAYAHNSQILVKEGQTVSRGQKIAEMGKTDADSVKLHFEIRRLGKPVDPLKYLPEKS